MSNHLVSAYLAATEARIEIPYSSRAVIFDFSLSLAFAFGICFVLLVL